MGMATVHLAAALGGEALRDAVAALPRELWSEAAEFVATFCDMHGRRAVARLFSEVGEQSALLQAFIHDPAVDVRYAIVKGAAMLSDTPTLEILAHDPSVWVRQAAGRGLVNVGRAGARSAVREMIRHDPSPVVRRTLVDALQYWPSRGNSALLKALCGDASGWVRAAAMVALPSDAAAVEVLKSCVLVEQVGWVRHIALRELLKRDLSASLEVIGALLGKVPFAVSGAMLRTTVLRAAPDAVAWLMGFVQQPATGSLAWVLESQDVLHARFSSSARINGALWELGQCLKGGMALMPLDPEHELTIVDDIVRVNEGYASTEGIAFARAMRRQPESMLALLERLRTSQSEVAREAATTLMQAWNQPEAVPMLYDMLDDSCAPQQERVAQALSQLAHTCPDVEADVMTAFERLASHASATARALVLPYLGGMAGPRAEGWLLTALRDPSAEVRKAALWPVARTQTDAAWRALSALARDPDPGLRHHLARASDLFAPQLALPVLELLARDPNAEVRIAVARCLTKQSGLVVLRLLDDMAHTPESRVREAVDEARSELLTNALLDNTDNYVVMAMLLRWVRELTAVSSRALYTLAQSTVVRRFEILRTMLDSPYPNVCQHAKVALSSHLEKRFKD